MALTGLALYRDAFGRRTAAMAGSDQTVWDEPGVCGMYGSADHPGGRLLITDDRAAGRLEALLPDLHPQFVNVFEAATRCRELIEAAGRWQGEEVTAMVCHDLALLPLPPTPTGLTIRDVRRVPEEMEDGVPLESAAKACLSASPETAGLPLPSFVAFLQSLPRSTRLLAALDEQGAVRATSGASALADDANAYFVSTDPQWRGRGVATAMTAAALAWAARAGARRASLDASAAGLSIYLRLGFEAVSPATLFLRFT